MTAAGIRSLAVCVPDTIRTNDYFRARHPELVANAEQRSLARLFGARGEPKSAFDIEMQRYLDDAFRGTVERRVLAPGETAGALEAKAGREAIERAGMKAADIDLVIVCSFLPDQIGIGNAATLVRDLGLTCPGWNLETACSSALVALHTASTMVKAGEYRNVLVVISCTYSRVIPDNDTLGWFMGDGAGAFVVSAQPSNVGVLGVKTVSTTATCGTFYYDLVGARDAGPKVRIQCTRETGKILAETSEDYLRECCEGAAAKAGVTLDQIDFFTFNTPTAWFAAFCARALGIPMDKTIDRYAQYGNVGTALMPLNLFHAAHEGRVKAGDLVLVYTIGSVSTASACVMRWGDVALGKAPDRSSARFESFEPRSESAMEIRSAP